MSNTELAKTLGVDVNTLESMMKTLAYRKTYNSRPDVREKRKLYTQARNARLSLLSKLMKGGE
jgi:hypothetical protein